VAYGITTRVPAPIEMYDAVHAELLARTGTDVDGLLLHIGRATEDGFEVVEVWESRDHYDRYNRELVEPLTAELVGAERPALSGRPQIEEFEVRGLVIPRGAVSL
jgi:quinol monooxygenase YgiN